MKNKILRLGFLALPLIICAGVFLSANAQQNKKLNNKPYINPTPGEITIMACSPIPSGMQPTRQAYEDLIDCGFNLGIEYGSIEYFKNQFKAIGDLNFKYIIGNGDLQNDNRIKLINEFKNDPHLGGWKFVDEPQYTGLNTLKGRYEELYKADPNNLIYINLVGVTTEKKFTGDIKSYRKYLDVIQEKFAPEVWSYDYYPISKKNGITSINYDQFYSDLEDMMAISKQTNRPFWAYCETLAYTTRSYSRPVATEPYLTFEAFSALAYGAQGIAYWTYGQRESNSEETYLSALVNMDGKKTAAWYAAKKVNAAIKKFNYIFYQCDVKEVKHTGDKLYTGTSRLTGNFGPFKKISSGKAGVMVSRINNGGKEYIVIVSRDVNSKQKVTLELNGNKSVEDLTLTTRNKFKSGDKISKTLAKGGYVIYRVE